MYSVIEVQLVAVLLERVDGRDARVRERRGRARLAVQPGAGRSASVPPRQRLEGDVAAEPRVVGEIDDAHAAAADLALDP